MASKLQKLLEKIIELQLQQNAKLDRLAAISISQQLLTECVDMHGNARDAETCAEIVAESFSAGLCLLGELEQRNKAYLYQMQEFFIGEPDDLEDDEDDEDDEDTPPALVNSF